MHRPHISIEMWGTQVFHLPAALGPEYFREVAEVSKAAAGGPPDQAKMAEIMRRYGLTMAPPAPQA